MGREGVAVPDVLRGASVVLDVRESERSRLPIRHRPLLPGAYQLPVFAAGPSHASSLTPFTSSPPPFPRPSQSCESLGCTANSEMVRQLVRRSHLLAPLPYHRTKGLTRREMLELAFDHLDLDGSGTLSVSEIVGFCRGLNPMKVHAEVRAMIRQMDKDGDESISRTEYLDSMSALADCLGDEEFERGVLETLATKPLISDLTDRESKMTALFRHLDADASGDLEVDELLAVFVDDAEVVKQVARHRLAELRHVLDCAIDGHGHRELQQVVPVVVKARRERGVERVRAFVTHALVNPATGEIQQVASADNCVEHWRPDLRLRKQARCRQTRLGALQATHYSSMMRR